MRHQLLDVFPEQAEGRVGDHDVCLRKQGDALIAAKVAVTVKRGPLVQFIGLELLSHIFQIELAIPIEVVHPVDDEFVGGDFGAAF